MVIGPIITLKSFILRPISVFPDSFRDEALVLFLFIVIVLALVLYQQKLELPRCKLRLTTSINTKVFRLSLPNFFRHLIKLGLTGLAMLILAYPLTFTVSATAINGRASRVHLAAIVGASILVACICSAIMFIGYIYKQKILTATVLAVFFGLLVTFGQIVQSDYKIAWQYQRAFWTDLIELVPDMNDETVILVEPSGLIDTKQIDANTWNFPRIIRQLYEYPEDWKNPPRAYRLKPGWKKKILSPENLFYLNERTTMATRVLDGDGTVKSSDVIFIETKNGKLTRRTKPLIIDGKQFILKEKSQLANPAFKKGTLYKYLIKSPKEKLLKYLT